MKCGFETALRRATELVPSGTVDRVEQVASAAALALQVGVTRCARLPRSQARVTTADSGVMLARRARLPRGD